jgi:photosystem II stability/assembly factor-like uncharacterized protein
MKSPRSKYHFLVLTLLCSVSLVYPQSHFLKSFKLGATTTGSSIPPSNSVSQINVQDSILWIGTSKGVAKSVTGGRSWESYRANPAFANDGIFAIETNSDTVWVSTGYDKDIGDNGTVQTGSGYAVSTNAGSSWQHIPQTLDSRGDSILSYGINDSLWFLPVVVPEQNVTFDISQSPGTIWVASWASGLRKSTNNGQSWQRIPLPPDNKNTLSPNDTLWSYAPNDLLQQHRIFQRFDPRRNNNFLAFGVHAIDNDTIWCGTAGGVNKSTDGGKSWAKFSHQNQLSGIVGNWVIAIDRQQLPGISRIWTTNWRANDPDEDFGVSYTDDGGRTWTNILRGIKAYDFAFKDSITYIATDDGVYRTYDGGASFSKFSSITDPSTRQVISSPQVFAVNVLHDTVFVGTGDGLASTIDNASNEFGSSWKIYRSYTPVGTSGSSYAYPNPFSPNSESVRIHYYGQAGNNQTPSTSTIDIDIFDFGMNRVRSLVHNATRAAGQEYDELWDGRNDAGKTVANGVYFYRIKFSDEQTQFGKILAIQ